MNHSHRFVRYGALALCGLASTAGAQVTTLLDLENSPEQAYTLYTYSFQASLAQTFLTFEFRQDPAWWSLDDVSVTNSANTQLLANGGFENGSYGNQNTPNDWTLIGQAGLYAGGQVSSGCAHSGNYCYSDGAVGGVDGLYQSFATTVGATYTLSFWLANDGGSIASAVVQIGASLNQGGVLVPVPPSATDIITAGSPYLAAGLGTTLNPVFDGGTLQLDSSGPVFSQNFTVNATNGTIDAAGLNSTMSGVLSGPGGLTFVDSAGGGSVVLTNANLYQGATTINGGAVLMLSGNGSIAASSGVADNGTLDISGTTAGAAIQSLSGNGIVALGNQTLTLTNAGDTFAGTIGGTGGLTLAGGTEVLSGTNAYSGATGIGSGATLALSGTGSIAASTGVADNGTFDISSTTAGAAIQSLSGNGIVALGNQTLTLTNAGDTFAGTIGGTGSLSVTGGNETLSGINTFSGAADIGNDSILTLVGAGSIAASSGVADNGKFSISGTTAGATIQSLSGNGMVVLGNQNLTLSNAGGIFAGSVSGTGGLSVSGGTEALSGTNIFSGATVVGDGATLALIGSGSIAASNGVIDNGTFNISGSSSGASIQSLSGNGAVALGNQGLTLTNASGTFAGNIDGTGGLAVTGGTAGLSGTNTFIGATAIGSGATLALSGTGSIAASSGVIDNGTFDISATTAGTSIQSLSGAGTVALGSQSLNLTNATGTFAGGIAGSGGLTLTGGNETLSGTNTFSGGSAIASGTSLALSGSGSVASSSGVADNGSLNISGTTAGATIQSLSGNGTAVLGNQNLNLSNASNTFTGAIVGTGGLAVMGGTEALSGTNIFTGATGIGNGATLALSGSGSIASSSGLADNGTLDISGTTAGATIQSLSGSGTVALGNQNLNLSNASGTFTGTLGGTGGLALSGGTETLTGTNTYVGGTTLSGGAVLIAGADAALGGASGVLTLNAGALQSTASFVMTRATALAGDGTFVVDAASTLLDNGDVSGVGELIKSGTGTLELCGNISNSGGTSVAAGSVAICGSDTGAGSMSVASGATLALTGAGSIATASGIADNGTFDISGATAGASIQSLTGNGTVALGNQNLTLTNGSGPFAGSIGGTGGLAITGGTETLSGSNGFSGSTAIGSGATLALSGTGGIASSSGVADNGTFDISGSSSGASIQSLSGNGAVALGNQNLTLTNASGTFAGAIGGSGGLAITGGTETLSGNNVFGGAIGIGAGATLALSGTGSIATSSGVTDNGRFDISGATSGASIQSLSGSGVVALGNQSLTLTNFSGTFAGVIGGTGNLAVTGGNAILAGTNTYSGTTSVSTGASLALGVNGSIAASSGVADNGTLDISGTAAGASIHSLSGSGAIVLGNRNLSLTSANGTFAGTIGGAGALAISGGTETLSGANTYTGGTTVSGNSQLTVGADAALGDAAGALTLNGGTLQSTASFAMTRALALTGDGTFETNAGTTLQDSGSVTGGGVLVKTGAGTLQLCGNVSNAGGVSVNAGALAICGNDLGTGSTSIVAGASLALTGAGSIARSSGITDDGTLDISGAAAGATIQSLAGAGNIALGGQTLTLANADGVFSGTIGGSGGIALTGGTETLTGSNTYVGGTVASNSKLIVSSDAALGGASGALTLSNSTLENTASIDTARSITLLGSNILSTDPGTALTQTGQISGDGHLTKVGDGTLVLAGDNRNWGQQGNNSVGGLTVNSGLVEVENSYGLGYGLITVNNAVIATTVDILTGQTILLSGATVLNVDAGTTTTLTGTVQTAGTGTCFEKTGTGTLVMSGAATLSNGTCVEQGQLYANGSINSIVSVDPGAVLRGVGLIVGAVTVQGTLAPGNSPGTLTVAGNVTMQAGSVYQEDLNGIGTGAGPGNYSRLLVSGAANQFIASGATLDVNLLNITGTATYSPLQPALGESFIIVTADGGIVGKFAAFSQPEGLAANTRLAIFYDPFGDNSIDLRVVPTSYASFLQAAGADSNARSAGNAMNQILNADQIGHATTAQDELAYIIGGISAAALPGVMTGLAGELHADLAAVAPQAGQWLQTSVARQLEFSDADGEFRAPLPGRAFWFDTTANHGKWDADDQASGFTTNRSQSALGFDLLVGHGNRVGVGYSHSLIDVSTLTGSGSIDENIGFIYGQYSLAPVIVDAMVGAGANRWGTGRADPLDLSAATLDTDSRGSTALASLGIRLPWQFGGVDFEPYARTLWQRVARTSFNEGSALDGLSGPDFSANGLRTTVGVLLGPKNPSPLASPFGYQINLGAGYDSGSLAHPSVIAAFAGTPTTIVAPDIGRTFAQLNLNGTARLGDHTYAYAGLSDEARSGKAEDAGINVGVRATF
jgi:fibronectin-binding autotransporter adhesin